MGRSGSVDQSRNLMYRFDDDKAVTFPWYYEDGKSAWREGLGWISGFARRMMTARQIAVRAYDSSGAGSTSSSTLAALMRCCRNSRSAAEIVLSRRLCWANHPLNSAPLPSAPQRLAADRGLVPRPWSRLLPLLLIVRAPRAMIRGGAAVVGRIFA